MTRRITITSGDVSAQAELNDSPCAEAIYNSLPVEAVARTWGDEVYFDISLVCELQADARVDLAVGDLGYWPDGRALCIFFGPTPLSGADGAPRAAGDVNPVGRVIGDPTAFKSVRDGDKIVASTPS